MNDRERQCGEDGELSTLKSLFHSFIENIAHSSSHTFNDTEHAIAFMCIYAINLTNDEIKKLFRFFGHFFNAENLMFLSSLQRLE